jgi:hypothetical protein
MVQFFILHTQLSSKDALRLLAQGTLSSIVVDFSTHSLMCYFALVFDDVPAASWINMQLLAMDVFDVTGVMGEHIEYRLRRNKEHKIDDVSHIVTQAMPYLMATVDEVNEDTCKLLWHTRQHNVRSLDYRVAVTAVNEAYRLASQTKRSPGLSCVRYALAGGLCAGCSVKDINVYTDRVFVPSSGKATSYAYDCWVRAHELIVRRLYVLSERNAEWMRHV